MKVRPRKRKKRITNTQWTTPLGKDTNLCQRWRIVGSGTHTRPRSLNEETRLRTFVHLMVRELIHYFPVVDESLARVGGPEENTRDGLLCTTGQHSVDYLSGRNTPSCDSPEGRLSVCPSLWGVRFLRTSRSRTVVGNSLRLSPRKGSVRTSTLTSWSVVCLTSSLTWPPESSRYGSKDWGPLTLYYGHTTKVRWFKTPPNNVALYIDWMRSHLISVLQINENLWKKFVNSNWLSGTNNKNL